MAMDDFLSGLPVIGGLFDDSDEEAQKYLQKILEQYQGIGTPDVSWRDYNPEMSQYDYNPEEYQANTIQEDPLLMQKQRDYLSRLSGLAESGMSEQDAAGYDRARDEAGAEAMSQRAAIDRNAAARGVGGGGLSFVQQQLANQSAANRVQDAGLQQASDAAKQRALYQQAYGAEMGDQRAADLNARGRNADILNRFNQMNVGARNDAQLGRIDNQNRNVDTRNQAQLINQKGRIAQNQQGYQNRMNNADAMADAYNRFGSYYANRGAKRAGNRSGLGSAIGTAIGGPTGGAIGGGLGDLF